MLEDKSGSWTVVSVRVDTSGVHARMPDDPELLGRRLVISVESIRLQEYTCSGPHATPESLPLADLVRDTYGTTVEKMRLSDLPQAVLPVYFIECSKGAVGPSFKRGSWIVQLGPDMLAMSWFDGALLLLRLGR